MRGTAAALAGRKKTLMVVIRKTSGKDEGDLALRGDRDEQHQRGTQQVADDHRRAKVPAVDEGAGDGRDEQVRERRGQEDEGGREGRVGDAEDEHGQRDLVQPVAEQADRLAQPEGHEAGVERQADVRVLADAGDDRRHGRLGGQGRRRDARSGPGRRRGGAP